MIKDLRDLQKQHEKWQKKNFGCSPSHHFLLGIGEEVGELFHAHLKYEQGIRTNEDHQNAKVDAIGDIVIYLAGYCNAEGIDLFDSTRDTWCEVIKRDWTKNKKDGVK